MKTVKTRQMEHVRHQACLGGQAEMICGWGAAVVPRAIVAGSLAALLLAVVPSSLLAQDESLQEPEFVVAARPQLDAAYLEATNSQAAGDGEASVRQTFFREGIFGMCGGRSAWWGWLLGFAFYIPGVAMGAANAGQIVRRQYLDMGADPDKSGAHAFCCGVIGTPIGYILFWGLPGSFLGWCLLGFVTLMVANIAAAAAVQNA